MEGEQNHPRVGVGHLLPAPLHGCLCFLRQYPNISGQGGEKILRDKASSLLPSHSA